MQLSNIRESVYCTFIHIYIYIYIYIYSTFTIVLSIHGKPAKSVYDAVGN